MATLVACQQISKSFGAHTLFADLSLTLGEDERIGLIGPNGAGKSTLLKLIAGLETVDAGTISMRRDLHVAYVPQDDEFAPGATPARVLDAALRPRVADEAARATQAAIMLTQLGFPDAGAAVAEFSGGWRKRLALAAGLVQQPDLLLLDEPTNHLDLEGILWLEELLAAARFAFVLISHDRAFLERVTNRVIELNPAYPAGHFSVPGPYSRFLEKRAEFLEGQKSTERVLANKVRREIEWLKAGPKAQRTKDKARIDAAGRKMAELQEVRERNRADVTARIEFDATGRLTRKLLAAEGIAKCVGGRTLFRDVTVRLTPGYRLGLLGPNGSGKTTLIRVLAGELQPDAGAIQRAEDLKVVVFDQKRERLPRDVLVSKALSPEGDYVVFRGQRIHVQGWAQRFLFKPQQLIMTVGELSGGEQARIQIARLMLQPADVLILDEPTNDLDLNSLEMLEENLEQFPGAIVLVTHDRFLMDRLCDEILALDGAGGANVYADLAQWQAARERARAAARSAVAPRRAGAVEPAPARPVRKLSYKDKLELEQMESRIAVAEEQLRACQAAAEDPAVASDHVELAQRYAALHAAQAAVDALYARWAELESRGG